MTGKDVYFTESVQGTDKAARRKADKVLTRLMSQVDQKRAASSSVSFGYAINEWLRTADLEESTREMYRGYVDRCSRSSSAAQVTRIELAVLFRCLDVVVPPRCHQRLGVNEVVDGDRSVHGVSLRQSSSALKLPKLLGEV